MPSSYAVMDEEEMTYVEGGATYKISKKTVYKKASVAGSVVWNWASACSGAAIAASNYSGNTMLKCVEQMTRTGDLVISISKK